MIYKASGIILAGGCSRRMKGTDKARMIIQSRPLLVRKIEHLHKLFAQVVVVCNRQQNFNFPDAKVVCDMQENCGPLMGLYSGLKASDNDINFATACDMPFNNEQLIHLLLQSASNNDVVAPLSNGYPEPLAAVYHKKVLPAIKTSLNKGLRKMTSFFDRVKVHQLSQEQIQSIDPGLLSFFNVNTQEDLKQAEIISATTLLEQHNIMLRT